MKRVLLLFNEPEIIHFIRKAFGSGVEFCCADSAQEACKEHQLAPFCLIFADLSLLQKHGSKSSLYKAVLPFKKINPSTELVVIVQKNEIRKAVNAIKEGAYNYLTYPIDPDEVKLVVESLQKDISVTLELSYLRDQFWKTEWLDVIHSNNPVMTDVFKKIKSVAPTVATVLLVGETGTGKGLLARLVHLHSLRSENSFISVHCGAIPETLIESELFGHEKGAFTGAIQKKIGKFEMAHNGTIFLDEIGTISAAAQIKLLQVLQDGTFSRIGGKDVINSNARIIAATNEVLINSIRKGNFRKDLFFRLNVFPVEVTPLRDRREDLPFLADNLLSKLNNRYGKEILRIHTTVIEAFKAYEWPGNIRELENVMERSYILETSNILTSQNLPVDMIIPGTQDQDYNNAEDLPLADARNMAIFEFENSYIKNVLAKSKGRVNKAAAIANITPRQLSRLMLRHGISKSSFKPK